MKMSKVIELNEETWDYITGKVIDELPLNLAILSVPAFAKLEHELFGEEEIDHCNHCVYVMVSSESEPCASCKYNGGEKNNFRKEF